MRERFAKDPLNGDIVDADGNNRFFFSIFYRWGPGAGNPRTPPCGGFEFSDFVPDKSDDFIFGGSHAFSQNDIGLGQLVFDIVGNSDHRIQR